MEPVAIIDQVKAEFPDEVIEGYVNQGQGAIIVRSSRVKEMLRYLRDDASLQMNHLRSLCGVDNSRRKDPGLSKFEVVYNLYSIVLGHEIRLRAEAGDTDPAIDSVVELWPGADWLERETYDLMGISFTGHPDLRRVLMPEDWEGHPLQKSYPLKGKVEWKGMIELLEKVKELDKHGFDPEGHAHGQYDPREND
ncbi:NADH-quinone oxidoreductase subunit C [Desulfobulbus rhabdoformis]|uniref:NADH-quinone oxidoreductase subunit C n=1 Tax=Desulfobulbus rhabdoformis TaxID=34032 RepID=UPI001965B5F8|nr:NADH-quinone oxidoreductase subunit C [Desulfobulbus rhabdoformis]MBM9614951.1 NADH-quinone oxidoreductase subunit C [Desulfobulbus rhabdoformis]